jgi:hypothetical protein
MAVGVSWPRMAAIISTTTTPPTTRSTRSTPKALDQQVAAYAVLAYLAAEADVEFGSAPKPAVAED